MIGLIILIYLLGLIAIHNEVVGRNEKRDALYWIVLLLWPAAILGVVVVDLCRATIRRRRPDWARF